MNSTKQRDPSTPPTGQGLVLWALWLSYGSFYFCRNNLGVALPGLGAELGYSKAQLGTVLMALKLAYATGQFINGQLAERFSPRKLLALGLLGSAALNVVFGWATGLYFLTFVWACNGYVQALGWTPTMRVAANWAVDCTRFWLVLLFPLPSPMKLPSPPPPGRRASRGAVMQNGS